MAFPRLHKTFITDRGRPYTDTPFVILPGMLKSSQPIGDDPNLWMALSLTYNFVRYSYGNSPCQRRNFAHWETHRTERRMFQPRGFSTGGYIEGSFQGQYFKGNSTVQTDNRRSDLKCWFNHLFQMRSEGFSFYILGVWGWKRVPVTLLLVSATVRNRLRTTIVIEKDVLMSFCVAGVALCDIRRVWGGMCMRGRREGKVAMSVGEATKTCLSRRVRRWAHVVLQGRRGTLDSTLYTLHLKLTLYTPHTTLHTLHSTLYTPHFTLHTLHFTLHSPHSPLYTPHFTLYTPHFTLYTPPLTLHTLHFTLHTPHSPLSTLHSPHSTLYTPLFTLHTLHTLHFTLHTPHLHLIMLALTFATWSAFGFVGFSCFVFCVSLSSSWIFLGIGWRDNAQETLGNAVFHGRSMVSCRFCLEPTHWRCWFSCSFWFFGSL